MYRAAIYFDIKPTHWAEVDTTRPQVCQQRLTVLRSFGRWMTSVDEGVRRVISWAACRPSVLACHRHSTLWDLSSPLSRSTTRSGMSSQSRHSDRSTSWSCDLLYMQPLGLGKEHTSSRAASALCRFYPSPHQYLCQGPTCQSEVQPPRRPHTSLRSIKLCT